jgi:prophage regulatory protein
MYPPEHSKTHTGRLADAAPAHALAPGEKFLRLPAVLELTGRGRTAWLDDVKAGKAPAPIKMGSASAWLLSEVSAWMAERIRESRSGGR